MLYSDQLLNQFLEHIDSLEMEERKDVLSKALKRLALNLSLLNANEKLEITHQVYDEIMDKINKNR